MAKILLVEDDKSLREIYGVRLMAEGYEIVSAGDGEEALAMAIKERPDLIVSDVMMPKISGFDMLDILRSTTETKNVKVIMMTALSSDDQRARGESLGADRYLVKSQVGIEDVVRTVHDVLGDSIATPAPAPEPVFPAAAPAVAPAPAQEPAVVQEAAPAALDTSIAPAPSLPEAPVAPAPVEAPVVPEPVQEPAPAFEPAAPAFEPTPAPEPVAPVEEPVAVQPAADPFPALPPQPGPLEADALAAPAPEIAPTAPAFEQPAPAFEPAAPAFEPTPAPEPVAPAPEPFVPPTPAPIFDQPAPAPAPAPTAEPIAQAPAASLPLPTAPFSTPAPASLGERVIAPLNEAAAADASGIPDISTQMEQVLNTPGIAQTPNNPQNPTL